MIEKAFPQLRQLVDRRYMRDLLNREFIGVSQTPQRILRLKLKWLSLEFDPQLTCRFWFEVKTRAAHDGPLSVHTISGLINADGSTKGALQALESTPSLQHPVPSVGYLESLDAALWTFPNDANMPHLAKLFEPQRQSHAQRQIAQNLGITQHAHNHFERPKLVKYVPANRCVLFHQASRAKANANQSIGFFTKIYRPKESEKVFDAMTQLWQSHACQSGELRMPKPLWHAPNLHAIAFSAIEGGAAVKQATDNNATEWGQLIGHMLHALQYTTLSGLAYHSVQSDVSELAHVQRAIEGGAADVSHQSMALVNALTKFAPADHATPVTMHGAFRLSQMLCAEGGIALLDFDGVRFGHPLRDVGSFLGHLCYLWAKGAFAKTQSQNLAKRFLRAYISKASWGVDCADVRWYFAFALSCHIKKCIKRLKPHRQETISILIDEATHALNDQSEWLTELKRQ